MLGVAGGAMGVAQPAEGAVAWFVPRLCSVGVGARNLASPQGVVGGNPTGLSMMVPSHTSFMCPYTTSTQLSVPQVTAQVSTAMMPMSWWPRGVGHGRARAEEARIRDAESYHYPQDAIALV